MVEREWNRGEIPHCTLDDILEANKPLDEILQPWPVFYGFRIDVWPDLLAYLGIEWDPERQRPFHVRFRGRELWRYRPEFAMVDHEVIVWELPTINITEDVEPPNYFDLTRLSTREPRTGELESE